MRRAPIAPSSGLVVTLRMVSLIQKASHCWRTAGEPGSTLVAPYWGMTSESSSPRHIRSCASLISVISSPLNSLGLTQ